MLACYGPLAVGKHLNKEIELLCVCFVSLFARAYFIIGYVATD
jgi:hypothetical protein